MGVDSGWPAGMTRKERLAKTFLRELRHWFPREELGSSPSTALGPSASRKMRKGR